MSKEFHMNERAFLNLPTHLRAYIIAYVEDTSPYPACHKQYRSGGQISLRIADCVDEIDLYFDLSNERERKNSLFKANKLVEILTKFRDAVEAEAKALEERETLQQHARAAYAIH